MHADDIARSRAHVVQDQHTTKCLYLVHRVKRWRVTHDLTVKRGKVIRDGEERVTRPTDEKTNIPQVTDSVKIRKSSLQNPKNRFRSEG